MTPKKKSIQQGKISWDFDFQLAKQQIKEKVGMPLSKYKCQEQALVRAGVDLRTKLGVWTLFHYVFNRMPPPARKKYMEKTKQILAMTKLSNLVEVREKYPEFWDPDINIRSGLALDKFVENARKACYIFPAMNPEEVFTWAQPHNFDIEKIRQEYKKFAKRYHPDVGGNDEQFHYLHRILERAIKLDQIQKASPTFAETLKENILFDQS